MSLLPFVFDPFAVERRPSLFYPPALHCRQYWDPFDDAEHLMSEMLHGVEPLYNDLATVSQELGGDVELDKEGNINISCSAAGFAPEELSVDVEGDRLRISGTHRDQVDGQVLERQFVRSVRVPKEVDLDRISCELDERGRLAVRLPRPAGLGAPKTSVPIQMKEQPAAQQPADEHSS